MTTAPSANTISAAAVRKKGGPFIIEQLWLEEPLVDEVLVRIVATGMCHTDMVVRDQIWLSAPAPWVCALSWRRAPSAP